MSFLRSCVLAGAITGAAALSIVAVACGNASSGASSSDGSVSTDTGALSGFTPICNADGSPLYVIQAFAPEDPPDYWALRTETTVIDSTVDGGDGGTVTWSAANTQESGTQCKTAKDASACMAALAARREYTIDFCQTNPFDASAGPPTSCTYTNPYLIATRGDRILAYTEGEKTSNFTQLFGRVVTWHDGACPM